MSTWVRVTTLILIFAGAAFLRGRDLFAPFEATDAGTGSAQYAIAARHLAREGFSGAGPFPIFDAEVDGDARADLEHPPLVHWLNAGVVRWFGDASWVLRLHHVVASLAICLVTYTLGRRAMGPLGALVAAALVAASPVLASHGARVDRLNVGLALTLLALWAHVRWNELGRLRDALRFMTFVALAACADGLVLPLVPMLALERALPRGNLALRRRLRAATFSLGGGAIGVSAAALLHLTWLAGLDATLGRGAFAWNGAAVRSGLHAMQARAQAFLVDGGWREQLVGAPDLVHPEVGILGVLGASATLLAFRRCERARSVILPGLLASLAAGWSSAPAASSFAVWAVAAPFLALGVGFLVSRTTTLALRTPRARPLTAGAVTALLVMLAVESGERARAVRAQAVDAEALAAPWAEVPPAYRVHLPPAIAPHPALEFYARRRLASYEPRDPWATLAIGALRQLDRPLAKAPTDLGRPTPIALLQPASPELARRLRTQIAEVVRLERLEVGRDATFLLIDDGAREEIEPLVALRRDPAAVDRLRAALRERSAQAPRASILYTDPLPEYRGRGPVCSDGVWFYFLEVGRYDDFIGAIPAPDHAADLDFRASQGQGARVVVVTAHAAEHMLGLRDYDGVRHRWEGRGTYWTAELPETVWKGALGGSH